MKSPFKFLDSFTKEDRKIFFGREKEIEELYRRSFRGKIMLVYGVSGTGKSSLINCGLANKFQDEDWLPINVRRGKNILESLYAAIVDVSLTPKSDFSSSEIQFKKYVKSLYLDHYKPIYFIFDQFEELFIFGSKDEKSLFVHVIKILVDSDIQCRFIFVMREEYMANVTEFERHIPEFFSNRVRIENMDHSNAVQAIEGPCKVFNINIEEGFPEELIKNLSPDSPDIELTYLQVFLDKIYRLAVEEQADKKSDKQEISFTTDQLKKIGNVSDLLGTFLNEQISLLDDPDSALAVLKSFVSVRGTKRQMSIDDIKEYAQTLGKPIRESVLLEMLQNFVNLRILRDKDQHERYELRHDSLATKIYEKISVVEKDILEIRQFIEDGCHNWQKRGVLLSANDLEYIAPYESRLFLSPELSSYITQSKNELEKVKSKRIAIFVASTFVLLVVFACFTVWALIERKTSKSQEIIAQANYYNALSKELVINDPTKALRIAEYACKLDPSENNYQNLVSIYSVNEFYFTYLPTRSLNVSDFKILNRTGNIALNENGKIRIINSKGETIKETNFNLPQNFIFDVSPDEKYYLIYTFNDTLKVYDDLWNLKSKMFLNNSFIDRAYFANDSSIVITAIDLSTELGKIMLWSLDGNITETKESFTYGWTIEGSSSDTIYFIIQPKELYCWIPGEDRLIKRSLKISGSERVYSGQFISKSKIALLSSFDTIRICNLDGTCLKSWYAGDDENRNFKNIYFQNEMNLLCAINNKIIKFWDLNGDYITNVKLDGSTIRSYQYSNLNKELLILLNNIIIYYKPINLNNELIIGKENSTVQYHTHDNSFIEYSRSDPQLNLLTIKGDKLEKTSMNFEDSKFYYKLPESTTIYTHFPELFKYHDKNQVIIYDINNGKPVVHLKDSIGYPSRIISSKDGNLIATLGLRVNQDSSSNRYYTNPSFYLFDSDGKLLRKFPTGTLRYYLGIKISSDNKYILTSENRNAILQDTTGKLLYKYSGHKEYIYNIDISNDGNYVLTGAYDKTVRLWSKEGKLLKVIQTEGDNFTASFLSDELIFQIAYNNVVKLYDINGVLIQKIPSLQENPVLYSPENRFLYYIENDGIHRTRMKEPVDSFILLNNHNDLTFNEKMEYNIFSVKELLKSDKPGDVYWGGKYFLDNLSKKTDVSEKKHTIKIAEKVFQKGLTFDTLHGPIARRLTELYIEKYQFFNGNLNKEIEKCYKIMIESNDRDDLNNALNYYGTITNSGELDSAKISYGYIVKVISLSRKLLEMFPNDMPVRQNISRKCSDLSFYLLDFKKYDESLTSVKIAIEADSTYQLSYTNLPLAYLFNNMFSEAEREYLKWKDKPWKVDNSSETFKGIFLLDIADLENRGITHPDFAKIKELLNQ